MASSSSSHTQQGGWPYFAALIATAMLAQGCGLHNQVYSERLGQMMSSRAPVVRVYIDRIGELYPPGDFTISGERLAEQRASVWQYYRYRPDSLVTSRCRALLAQYNVVDPADCGRVEGFVPVLHDSPWETLQDRMRDSIVRSIVSLTCQGRKTLVVLVHGFNAEDPTVPYEAAQELILNRYFYGVRRDSVAFLNVYWDGVGGDIARLPRIWGYAQANAFPAGLALRRILSALPAETPVRLITHSLGSTVASAALFNVRRTIADSDTASRDSTNWKSRYWRHMRDSAYQVPQLRDLAVGMIVPAMPTTTFLDYDSIPPTRDTIRARRIIVGMNSNDYAVARKLRGHLLWIPWIPLGMNVGCGSEIVGGTCAGVSAPLMRRDFVCPLQHGGVTRPLLIDFSHSTNNTLFHGVDDHSLLSYLHREQVGHFLDAVFGVGGIGDEICTATS